MLLLIDNYDSFVFNLARYVRELGVETRVVRNDALTVAEIRRLRPAAILLSPGPCTPSEAGICLPLIRKLGHSIPMLGVCLGHQALGAAFGANIIRAPHPVHGSTSEIHHTGTGLFEDCPQPFIAARYHSLIVEEASLSTELEITARTLEGLIMGLAHRQWPLYGVQFHPESILTVNGHLLLSNFLQLAGCTVKPHTALGDRRPDNFAASDFFAAPIAPDAQRPF